VQRGDAKHSHDGIADELLDGAAMPFKHEPDGIEATFHHPSQSLWIEPLADSCGAD
jgi:hypothetical protein